MKIYYKDGGILECCEIQFGGDTIYADDIYTVPIDDVDHIEDGGGERDTVEVCIEVAEGLVQNVYAIGPADVNVTLLDFDLDEDWSETDESIAQRHKALDDFRTDPGCRRVW